MGNEKKWGKRKNVVLVIVFVLFTASIVYAIYMFLQAPAHGSKNTGERVKKDYFLLSLQCGVASVLVFLPKKVENKFELQVPNVIQIMYLVFLFASIFLGEVSNFYYRVPVWDRVLHFFSAGMLGTVGFFLVDIWTGLDKKHVQISPGIVSFFAFCFAMAASTIWEIYEYASDGILKTNMQKYISYEYEVLAGREVLFDTMGDFLVNTMGALVAVLIGYFYLHRSLKIQNNNNINQERRMKHENGEKIG